MDSYIALATGMIPITTRLERIRLWGRGTGRVPAQHGGMVYAFPIGYPSTCKALASGLCAARYNKGRKEGGRGHMAFLSLAGVVTKNLIRGQNFIVGLIIEVLHG